MNPLATVCSGHGVWLTPVPTRTLAQVRHAEDFVGLLSAFGETQALQEGGPDGATDALWLQQLCTKQALALLPWGRSPPHDLIRIVDALARQVICATRAEVCAPSAAADRPVDSVKDFVSAGAAGQLARISLPTQLRRRQWVLARVAHVLRQPPATRTCHALWSAASARRLALMRAWPDGALSWVCPEAAELSRREDALGPTCIVPVIGPASPATWALTPGHSQNMRSASRSFVHICIYFVLRQLRHQRDRQGILLRPVGRPPQRVVAAHAGLSWPGSAGLVDSTHSPSRSSSCFQNFL